MRTIDRPASFKRDYKREAKGAHSAELPALLQGAVRTLAADSKLAPRYRDHALTGDWNGCRECHLKPDLLLIYKKIDTDKLLLLRLGSHSELFG